MWWVGLDSLLPLQPPTILPIYLLDSRVGGLVEDLDGVRQAQAHALPELLHAVDQLAGRGCLCGVGLLLLLLEVVERERGKSEGVAVGSSEREGGARLHARGCMRVNIV